MQLSSIDLHNIADKMDQLAKINVRVNEFVLNEHDNVICEVRFGYSGQRDENPTYWLMGIKDGTRGRGAGDGYGG